MKQDQNAARIGIYIDKQLLSRCDAAIPPPTPGPAAS